MWRCLSKIHKLDKRQLSLFCMGIFSFFKSKKSAEPVAEIESMAFDGIKSWLDNKDKALRENEREALGGIHGRLDEFYVSVEEKLEVLNKIDIESRKEHGRAKLLVRQGLDKYINFVGALVKDLRALGERDLEKFAREIIRAFTHFEKTSAASYGRATYLIGDEMAAVRNEIRRAYNDIAKLLEGDKLLVESSRKIEKISSKLDELGVVERNFGEAGEEIIANEKRVEKAKKNIEKLESEIEEIKSSSEYTSGLKARDEIKNLRIDLDSEISRLKGLIDFKRLISIVHSNQKELGIVKSFKDHFASEFSKDRGDRILDLLEGSNMKGSEIGAQVDLIGKKSSELDKKQKNVGRDYTVAISKEVKGIGEEIESLELGNVKGQRRLEELGLKMKGLKNEVAGLVEGMGVVVG